MRHLRPAVSYANIVATLALVVALGGVSYAATALPRGSVGTAQLRGGAVTTAKLKGGAVTKAKIGKGAVTPDRLSAASRALAAAGPASPGVVTAILTNVPSIGPGAAGTSVRNGAISGVSDTGGSGIDVVTLSPSIRLTAGHLTVRAYNDLSLDSSVKVELVVSSVSDASTAASSVACTMVGDADPDPDEACTSSATVSVPPSSFLAYRVTVKNSATSSVDPRNVYVGLTLTPAS